MRSAQRHEPTRHLPAALALLHVWYPDVYIPLFTVHCKTSPVNKQMVSGTVFIWRGSIACGGGRAAALEGNVQCKQPRWQQAEGVAVLQPGSAASGVAGTGVKPLHP